MRIPRNRWHRDSTSKTEASSSADSNQSQPHPNPRADRNAVTIRGVARLPNYSVVPITLVDLSYEGCRVEIEAELVPGEKIQITIRGSVISAKVCWCGDGVAGLSFTSEAPFELRKSGEDDARATKRLKTTIRATMQRHGQTKYAVLVSDMSPTGCKVEFVDRPEVDERVHMRFSGLESIEGTVRWIADHKAGVYFERPIHPAVFEQMIEPSVRKGSGSLA